MKIKINDKAAILKTLHLDRSYSLMTVKNAKIVYNYFKILDIHGNDRLDDVQFATFMSYVSDFPESKITLVYEMLDFDNKGFIEFSEFYLIICILIALDDGQIKEFIYRHSKIVFELIDADAGGTISAQEFERYGFLFNLEEESVLEIFTEFDYSGDEELDYKEFKMFSMACIDKQREIDNEKREKLKEQKRKRDLMKQKWWAKYFFLN